MGDVKFIIHCSYQSKSDQKVSTQALKKHPVGFLPFNDLIEKIFYEDTHAHVQACGH